MDNTDIDDMGAFTPGVTINTDNNYSFDEEGRLIRDVTEGIEKITWRVDEERALLVKTEIRTRSSKARRTVKSIERPLNSGKKNIETKGINKRILEKKELEQGENLLDDEK